MSDKFRLMMDSKAKTKEEIQQELQRMIELKAHPEPQNSQENPPEPAIPATSGEGAASTEDIAGAVRQSVREKIHSIVQEALESAREEQSYGERIPPREPRKNIDYLTGREIPSAAPRQDIQPDELAYPASFYEDNDDPDNLRTRISEMRRLSQQFYNGYMLRQCAEETLVKQGEYMKDVTDDFPRNCFCGVDRPVYGALSTDQLRTYFTWRTGVRRGVWNRVDKPYIMLYCYELLNCIGVNSAEEAYCRLSEVWENCRDFCPALDKVMPRWLKDLRAFNIIGGETSPAERLTDNVTDADSADILVRKYSGKLEFLMQRSSYNLRGSIFWTDENSRLMESALEYVLSVLDGYFTERGITMFELLCGRLKKDHGWSPFAGAYVDLDRMEGFHPLKISPMEQYCVKRGQPCLEVFEPAPYRYFIGWILKSTESVLRKRTGFRYGLSANITPVMEDMANRDRLLGAVSTPEFADIVTDAAGRWCDEHGIFPPKKQKKRSAYNYDEAPESPQNTAASAPRAPVEIDVSKLARIREEADETTRKLIVEEVTEIPAITERVEEIQQDSFQEQTEGFTREYSESQGVAVSGIFDGLADGWREFAQSLSAEDIRLIRALLDGNADEFCRSRGIMPETVYDRINDAAMENVGDILIENGAIIEDYMSEAENIAALAEQQEDDT